MRAISRCCVAMTNIYTPTRFRGERSLREHSRRFAPPSALAASLPAFSITRPRGTRERLKTDSSPKWGARVGIFAGTAAGRTRRVGLGRDGGRGGGHERPEVYLGVDEVRRELSHGKERSRDEAKDERRADWRSATGETRAKLEFDFRARS